MERFLSEFELTSRTDMENVAGFRFARFSEFTGFRLNRLSELPGFPTCPELIEKLRLESVFRIGFSSQLSRTVCGGDDGFEHCGAYAVFFKLSHSRDRRSGRRSDAILE